MPPCDRIRKFRLQAGLTQEQLADLVGVRHEEISRLENGKRDPLAINVTLAIRIAETLGHSVEEIFAKPKKKKATDAVEHADASTPEKSKIKATIFSHEPF